MADVSLGYQIGAGAGAFLAGIGFTARTLKKKFNNRNGNSKPVGCQDAGCHKTVEQHGKAIGDLCHSVNDEIFPKINQTAEDVSYIKGRIDGALGVIK